MNGHAVTTMAGLSSAVVLAAILLLALIMVCIKLEAYDIFFPSKKNGGHAFLWPHPVNIEHLTVVKATGL